MSGATPKGGMSVRTATRLEYGIIGLGVLALLLIFQPFNLMLFSIGCVLVVVAGLMNNLLPLCEPGYPLSGVIKVGLIVLAIFFVVAAIAIGSAMLYGVYLRSLQGG
jgi:hypothetical protein